MGWGEIVDSRVGKTMYLRDFQGINEGVGVERGVVCAKRGYQCVRQIRHCGLESAAGFDGLWKAEIEGIIRVA